MNGPSNSLTMHLTRAGRGLLAVIWLAACDDDVVAPRQASQVATTALEWTTPPEGRKRQSPSDDGPATNLSLVQLPGTETLSLASGRFDIDVVMLDTGGQALRSAIRRAARRWTAVLGDTELPDVLIPSGPKPACLGARVDNLTGLVDDLAILVSTTSIDGPGGTLALGGPCWVRWGSYLPYVGLLILDQADVNDLGEGEVTDLLVHEIGHVLGIGALWGDFRLVRSPSLYSPGADTHFDGSAAVAAFDAAGGEDYGNGKVPVENLMGPGSSDMHWRESVLASELMTPVLGVGEANPLSAITIQSLVDLGYTVDVSLADAFTLAAEDSGTVRGEGADGRAISLGGDVLTGPLLAFDTDGRMVRKLRR